MHSAADLCGIVRPSLGAQFVEALVRAALLKAGYADERYQ
jgi:hypothetical protein